MFNLIGIGERAGSGIPDIYQVWENQGWVTPVVKESYNPDRTALMLEFKERQTNKTSEQANKRIKQANKTSGNSKQTNELSGENEQAEKINGKNKRIKQANRKSKTMKTESLIRLYLNQNGLSKTSDISKYIGLSPARTRAILSNMQDISYEGSTKNRKYKLGDNS